MSCPFLSIFHIFKVQITFANFFEFFVKILQFSLDFYIVSFLLSRLAVAIILLCKFSHIQRGNLACTMLPCTVILCDLSIRKQAEDVIW